MSIFYTETEKKLSSLWQELNVANKDRSNNFFASGGDSLLLIRLSMLIKEKLNIDVGISELLQCPVLADMAEYIDSQKPSIIPECHKYEIVKNTIIPLSSSQRGIWFQSQLDSVNDNKDFNIPLVFQMHGEVDIELFKFTLDKITARHKILNATFNCESGLPEIRLNGKGISFNHIDMSDLPDVEQKDTLNEIQLGESARNININSGPLIYVTLVKQSNDNYYLFITGHHLVFDGISYDIFLCELTEIYADQTPEVLKIDYIDFTLWENGPKYKAYVGTGLKYWQEKLDNFTPIELPMKTIDSLSNDKKTSLFCQISSAQINQLNSLAKQNNTTLYVVFSLALQVVLNKLKVGGDIAFGTYVSNRILPEFNEIIGNFVNPLLLKFNFNANHSISDALKRTHDEITQDFIWQNIPFESIVQKINPERRLGEHSLFELTFIYNEDVFHEEYSNEYFTIKAYDKGFNGLETNRTDIELWIRPNASGLQCELNIVLNKVNRQFAKVLLDGFENMLLAFIQSPASTLLNDLPFLPQSYEYSILEGKTSPFVNKPISELIRQNAIEYPQKVIIADNQAEYTYKYLEDKSNYFANRLDSLNIVSGDVVGVLLPHSVDLAISVLSILKSGGIILLLDPTDSPERLQAVVNSAKCQRIITSKALATTKLDSLPHLLIDELPLEGMTDPVLIRETDLTYMVYTSGSTGRAKALFAKRYGLLNRVYWLNQIYPFKDSDKFILKTSVSFVDFYAELFSPLILGYFLYIANDDTRKNPADLIDAITENKITHITLTPTLLREICRDLQESHIKLDTLKNVISSGEILTRDLAKKVKKYLPNAKLLNIYGSSEMSADIACYEVKGIECSSVIPVGKLIYNSKAKIVNKSGLPVAKGLMGELWVSGEILADGYASADMGLENVFFNDHGERWFKTGDYACLNPQNDLVIIGRKDDRQKIRGMAVDLREIDRALLTCCGVTSSCTVVISLGNEEQILAALLETDQGYDDEAIYLQLAQKLPRSLIPGLIKTTKKLPTLSGGKVDKQGVISILNDVVSREPMPVNDIVSESAIEIDLENMWQELLNITTRIGVQQNFFRLGGHSLLASRLLGKIRSHFAIDITLSDIFNSPTIAELANLVSQSVRQQVDIFPVESLDNLYDLSFNQERLLYLQHREPQSISYNMTFSITLTGKIDLAKLTFALNEIIKRHDVLRSHFTEIIDEKGLAKFKVKVNDLGYVFPNYSIVTLDEFDQAVQTELSVQHHLHFDLTHSPLLRVSVVDTQCDKSAIVICMHHIVSDGWSVAVLFKELSELYNNQLLKPLPFRHVDYAHWIRGWITDEKRSKTLKQFWQNYLLDINALPISAEARNDVTKVKKSKVITRQYHINLNSIIENNFKEYRINPYDLVLTAFSCVLSAWKQTNNYLIGTVSAGRHLHSGSEDIIGFLANTLPIKINIDAQSSLTDILLAVVATRRDILQYQDLPFDAIVNSLVVKESSATLSSLIQVMCVHQNIDYKSIHFQDAQTRIDAYLGDGETKFELVLQTAQLEKDCLNILVEYSETSFHEFEIGKLLDGFIEVLQQLAKKERPKLAELNLFPKKVAYQNGGKVDIPPDFPKTLSAFLKNTAQNYPTHSITIIDDQKRKVITYKELYEKSVQCARKLNNLGLQKGDVIVLIPDQLDEFFSLFWGAILARVIPVVVTKPLDFSRDDSCYKLIDACQLFNYAPIVTNGELVNEIQLLQSRHRGIRHFNTKLTTVSRDFVFVQPLAQDTVFYQLTSGSTGKSKAISERHEALAAYVYLSSYSRNYNPTDRLLNWLPMDHIGPLWLYHLRAVCVGSNQIHISTPLVLEKPLLWLELITEFKVTHSWAPNFAYKLVINEKNKLVSDQSAIDLSSLKELVTGGEMVTGYTVRTFNHLLKPLGLREGVLTPSFGMAESCTCITYGHIDDPEIPISYLKFNDQRELQAGSSSFTSLGKAIAGVEIRIADDDNNTLEEYHVGHYQIRGPNVTDGYYNQSELNQSVFSEEGWFDSGDNGFIADGNLYLVGRTKEMLIVNGKNYFCHEIEELLEQIEGIESTYIAAFSIKNVEQEEIVICYVPTDPSVTDRINQDISRLLYRSIGLYVNKIIPVMKSLFLKTTSGKIQRAKMAQKFIDGELLSISQYQEKQLNVLVLDWKEVDCTEQLPNGDWLFVGDIPNVPVNRQNVSLEMLEPSLTEHVVDGVVFSPEVCQNSSNLLSIIQLLSRVRQDFLAQMTVFCLIEDNSEIAGLAHGLLNALSSESALKQIIVIQTQPLLPVVFPKNLVSGWYKQQNSERLEKFTKTTTGDLSNHLSVADDTVDEYAVITGAGGGIAALLLKELAANFTHLILLGRGKEPEYVQQNRQRLHWVRTDFTDLKQLLAAYQSLKLIKPPKFIYHLAGIAEQASIKQMTVESLDRSRQPKTFAIENVRKVMSILYPATCKTIRFILFGSVVVFKESPMLGGYIAANAELLGYAQAKRHDGYLVTWLGWSAWQNIGMVQGKDKSLLKHMGLQIVDANNGISMLKMLQTQNHDFLIGLNNQSELSVVIQPVKSSNVDGQHIDTVLLDLVKAILSVESVGLHDNFFELGLSSIDLTRLHRSINNRLDIEIDLVDILQFSTISKLSTYIQQNKLTEGIVT